MNKLIANIWLKACLVLLSVFIFFGNGFGQNCEAAPNEILLDLVNQADLPAVATQYGLNPTPISSVGVPPTYRMQITNGQTACQIAAAMQGDARISQKESNRTVKLPEKNGLDWTNGQSW